jgi:hypothetical protein
VVEGARLESEACERHRTTSKSIKVYAISDLAFRNDWLVRVGKPRCCSSFLKQTYHSPITIAAFT